MGHGFWLGDGQLVAGAKASDGLRVVWMVQGQAWAMGHGVGWGMAHRQACGKADDAFVGGVDGTRLSMGHGPWFLAGVLANG